MFTRLLLWILAVIVAVQAQRPYFRSDYTYSSKYNGFYKFHASKMGFSDAVITCKAEGAELFLPGSQEESAFAFSLSARKDAEWAWIALHDLFGESSFTTLSGVPLDELYSNWGPGEPNNVGQNEHCVLLKKDTTFNDAKCTDVFHFVCVKSGRGVAKNNLCQTYDSGYVYRVELDACYKLHTSPTTWKDAYRTCRAEQAQLVIINSDVEAKYLVSLLAAYPEHKLPGSFNKANLHVGFNDIINQGLHKTIDGKLVSQSGYTKWSGHQPDNQGGVEQCGSIFRDGLLNDIGCDERCMFVCEKTLTADLDLDLDHGDGLSSADVTTKRIVQHSTQVSEEVSHQMPVVDENSDRHQAQFSVAGALVPLPDV